jgi:hypothetical protein
MTFFTALPIRDPFGAALRFLEAAGFRFGALAAFLLGGRAFAFFWVVTRRFPDAFAI